jgi:single-strand DNA-binding protein
MSKSAQSSASSTNALSGNGKPWSDLNHFKCRARVGNKPEIRTTRKNPVTSCTLYVKSEYDDDNGKRVTKTTRIPLTMFGDRGMTFANEVNKGDYIEVEGRIQENAWEDADGNKRSRLELHGSRYQIVQRKVEQKQAA